MSLFGPTDDSDLRRWQHVALQGLTRMIKLGHERKLPPILWELPTTTAVTGRIRSLGTGQRDTWQAWLAALTKLCGPATLWPERTNDVGKTTLLARFELLIADREPKCDVVLIAEFYVDEPAVVAT